MPSELKNVEGVKGEMDIGKLNKYCIFTINLNFKNLPSLMNYSPENVQTKIISWIKDKSFLYGEG